ncbi:MAG TPA: phage tail sheath subtilisin-like domain-containing protein [Kofleriaceae bacterium]|nr:phage tail sheath subtilisin-like domain-containing protein [Kofleriaceae bacterium]
MNVRPARAPGLAFEAVRSQPAISPLRSDVAGFIGRTRRGPIGAPVRVEGWRGYLREFGGLDKELDLPYAVRGYFENGGEVAWIVRTAGPRATVSSAIWDTLDLDGILAGAVRIDAGSPGAWSEGARVTFSYRGRTSSGVKLVDVLIRAGEEGEEFRAVPARELIPRFQPLDRRAPVSRLIGLAEVPTELAPAGAIAQGTRTVTVTLTGGAEEPPSAEDYLAAIEVLDDIPEVALLAFPDVHDLRTGARQIFRAAAEHAEALRDRLVLIDLPLDPPEGAPPDVKARLARRVQLASRAPWLRWHADDIMRWVEEDLERGDADRTGQVHWWRAAALYHPWVRVQDPHGGAARPYRDIAPSGHVAGVISRLDRERGAHATPANAPLFGVIDLREEFDDREHALLNEAGIDLVRCVPALGFSVWGGRTLDRAPMYRFIAHRRLIHRLVRAIRRLAEPLVFETNGPALWFAFVRAITALLLEAWRVGALAGARPEEAFQVTCDDSTNPPEEIERGRCVCKIAVAPAIPMEFILIRVALSRDGSLEVLS